jgi:hypothetical protein
MEAFFVLKYKGGELKVRYCRPCQKVGLASPQGTRK